mmetsp:Transcript_52409/g.170102  ORF Transcript_52409/g.170102 Transcript_52409/m.170102 type:complete len:1039 (-) Transcript_52409:132-3248(-)
MVVLEAIGLASKEVFDYNRENFSFDNEQRLDMEKTRLAMQVERFTLFREDIEDLVNLTVSKMDMYHAVAALLLGSATTLYTEGRMHVPGNTPPWYIAIYFISIAGTFCYLLLAVWLSMYASVASHSFGVRLRTRYVRLPIPSLAQLQSLTAKLQNFEKQGAGGVLRVPFASQDAPKWQLEAEREAQRQQQGQPASSSSPGAPGGSGAGVRQGAMDDWLGDGEAALGKEDIVFSTAAAPGQHVQLFRRLQARWQCYDAYARVSMSIGINQLLQTLNYYLIGCCLIENETPSTAIALTLVYQAGAMFILYMDVAGVSKLVVFGIQIIGTVPATVVLVSLAIAEREKSGLLTQSDFNSWSEQIVPVAFFFELLWFEALLWLASPSRGDEAALPRKFRSVLFLDVFGDASYDPTEAEVIPSSGHNPSTRARQRHSRKETEAASAERHVLAALSAVRRWEAVPGDLLNEQHSRQLRRCRQDYDVWRRAFAGHIVQQKSLRGVSALDLHMIEEDITRAWEDLNSTEQEHDPFANFLLGPFELSGQTIYFDLEFGQRIYQDVPGREVLTLKDVQTLVKRTELVVQTVLEGSPTTAEGDSDESDDDDEEEVDSDGEPLAARQVNSGLPTKVERLPWKVLRRITRCFQLCWLFLGVMDILYMKELGFDSIRGSQKDEHVKRRLRRVEGGRPQELPFDRLEVHWPHGRFFQPSDLAWIPNSSAVGTGRLIVSSPYLSYQAHGLEAHGLENSTLRMAALPKASFPSGSTLFCPAVGKFELDATSEPCLVGMLTSSGLSVWPFGRGPRSVEAVVLAIRGEAWRSLAGAIAPCGQVSILLPALRDGADWCLVLAGWDGEQIPVAAVPLGTSASGGFLMPSREEVVVPRLDAPLSGPAVPLYACPPAGPAATGTPCQPGGGAASIAALHVEPSSGRLWALHDSGDLEAWDLLGLRRLGRFRPRWPAPPRSSRVVAVAAATGARAAVAEPRRAMAVLCEVPGERRLLVAGLELSGPALFSARLPLDLDAELAPDEPAADEPSPSALPEPPIAV